MSYAHRYYYLTCCMLFILVSGYAFDVRFILAEHARLLMNVEEIKSKIRAAQREIRLASSHADQADEASISDHFSKFSRLARTHHLEILSVVSVRGDDASLVQAEEYQIVMSGNYADLYHFLAVTSMVEMKNMVLSAERQQRVRVEMRLRFADEIAQHDVPFAHVINPFCGAEKPHAAKKFSSDEMQYLGAVVRDGMRYKIELSPDGVVSETGEG